MCLSECALGRVRRRPAQSGPELAVCVRWWVGVGVGGGGGGGWGGVGGGGGWWGVSGSNHILPFPLPPLVDNS